MNLKSVFLFPIIFLYSSWANAGSTYYFGLDSIYSRFTGDSLTVVISDSVSDPNVTKRFISQNYTDFGSKLGYKKLVTDSFYYSPELSLSLLNKEDLLYGANFKLGYDIGRFSVFGQVGLTRFDIYDIPTNNFGAGIEYKISDRISLNLQWLQYQKITEQSRNIAIIEESTRIESMSYDQHRISSFMFGLVFYWNE